MSESKIGTTRILTGLGTWFYGIISVCEAIASKMRTYVAAPEVVFPGLAIAKTALALHGVVGVFAHYVGSDERDGGGDDHSVSEHVEVVLEGEG